MHNKKTTTFDCCPEVKVVVGASEQFKTEGALVNAHTVAT